MTETEQAAAIQAALTAALAPAVGVYEYDKVPGANGNQGTEPRKYATFSLARRYTEGRRGSGEVTSPGFRLVTRAIAKSVDDAREIRRRVVAALEDKILTSTAGEIGPFVFETSDPVQPDQGYFVADDTWTF